MRYVDEFRGRDVVAGLAKELHRLADHPVRLMQVCGTHTMAIFRHGLRALIPREIDLLSGPGCPVCVTTTAQIDQFVTTALRPHVTVATFGDLIRVPGSCGTLAQARAEGARIEVVYSPMDALDLAERRQEELVVFLGVGFETTIPGMAATVREAWRRGLSNFALFSATKLMPPALEALIGNADPAVAGLLCPGHVSTIIGTSAYTPLVNQHGLPCVVGGFEPADILYALVLLVRQVREGRSEVENAYPRAVSEGGNARARGLVAEVFEPVDAEWRGLGLVPKSGLALRKEWAVFDASKRLNLTPAQVSEPPGCRCGAILTGRALPSECPLFNKACTPVSPVGPCMVSSEGTCAAYYRYGY